MNNTSNLIATASNKDHVFCFLIKPSPGRRRVDLICNSQFSEVSQIGFVSNKHVFVKFKTGESLTLEVSGKAITQSNKVQFILDNRYAVKNFTLISNDHCRSHKSHAARLIGYKNNNKHESSRLFIFEFQTPKKTYDPHNDFKVICFRPNGKGEIILEQLNHQIMHKKMLEDQFRKESRATSKKLDVPKMITQAKLHFKELRFDSN